MRPRSCDMEAKEKRQEYRSTLACVPLDSKDHILINMLILKSTPLARNARRTPQSVRPADCHAHRGFPYDTHPRLLPHGLDEDAPAAKITHQPPGAAGVGSVRPGVVRSQAHELGSRYVPTSKRRTGASRVPYLRQARVRRNIALEWMQFFRGMKQKWITEAIKPALSLACQRVIIPSLIKSIFGESVI